MKMQIRYLLVILFFVFGISFSFAQDPGDPGGAPAGDPPVGDTAVPIDGGAVLLLAAGAAYGAKKLRDKKKIEE